MNILNFCKKNNDYYIYYDNSYTINMFIYRIYGWISYGLFLTSIISWLISKNSTILYFIYNSKSLLLFTFSMQFIIAFFLYNLINNLNENFVIFLFTIYSFLTGINFSTLFILYNFMEISISFFVTFLMFIFMTLYGFLTKKDLTNFENVILMLILGIFISSIFNYFLQSKTFIWFISYINILIFTILISYDTQKLKILGNELIKINNMNDNKYNSLLNKYSIFGALILYLDFLNLFLIPLKTFFKKNKE